MNREWIEDISKRACELEIPDWLRVDENFEAHYYRFLYLLAKEFGGSVTFVELGTWRGVSAMCLAEGCPSAKVVTIDVAAQVIESTRRSNITYLLGDSQIAIADLAPVDLLFIDTDHDKRLVASEFDAWLPLLAPDCVVLFDDINFNEGMQEFWKNFNPEQFEKFDLPIHGSVGFGALVRITDDDGGSK